ncbi:tetratricopeptide repeat protein [Roseibium sp. CAU 1637]|uniref:Tetratricopeptide repeat protein n=1 Tax=Roseibium limicola TaxID=2816037 RepID=A0A939J5D3_9HYPH|nr:tetratricopeptide repeat protein [Roseibium limicola]MBO0345695.1 tetratricopeptide repeat protein [Roseibium limicola]
MAQLRHITAKSRIRTVSLVMAVTAAALLGGCANSRHGSVGTHAAPVSGSAQPGSAAAQAQVSQWGQSYNRAPQNPQAILGYANALTQNGQTAQSMAVLRKGVLQHPNNQPIASAYGKVLAINGQFEESLNVIKRVQTPAKPDWKLLSAEAAVLDQMGNHARAKTLYHQALQINPNDPSILNNLALSHLMSKELPEAEYTLRRAASAPGADSQVRQNLALVLGLQGKFQEAEQVASTDISPEDAKANIAYLRQMLSASQS